MHNSECLYLFFKRKNIFCVSNKVLRLFSPMHTQNRSVHSFRSSVRSLLDYNFFFSRRSIGISVAFDTENIAKSHFLHTHTGCFLCVVTTNMDESNNGACIRTKHTVSYPIGSFCYSVYQFDFTNSPIRFCHLAGKWCAQHIVCRSNDFFVFFLSCSPLFHACMCWPLMMYLFSIKGFRKRKSIKLRTLRRMRTYMSWSLVCVCVCMFASGACIER